MLQADEPTDYVVATGTSYTVRDFVQLAFEQAGLDWEKHVKFDPALPAAHRSRQPHRRPVPRPRPAGLGAEGPHAGAWHASWSTPILSGSTG